MIVYLDSSAIVKRYIYEDGSDIINELYEKTLNGDIKLSFSIWNIGEVIGVFDRYCRRGWIDVKDYEKALTQFKVETRRLIKLKLLILIPVRVKLLLESWCLITKYHIYVADALQIVSAKSINANNFVSSDKELCKIAQQEKLNTMCVG